MKNFKRLLAAGVAVMLLGASSVSALAAYASPAEAVAGLTGKTVEAVAAEKLETGKTYGALAKDAGKLAEFQKELLQMTKDTLAKQVAAGVLTQAQADGVLTIAADRQALCSGDCDGLSHNESCGAAHDASCARGAGHRGGCTLTTDRAATGHHGGMGRRGGCYN